MSATVHSIDSNAWIDRARRVPIEDEIKSRGIKLNGNGSERDGPCPKCGGEDRFSINTKKNVFYCRGCQVGGDVIALVQHLDGSDFLAACTRLANEPPPQRLNGKDQSAEPRKVRTATYQYDDESGGLAFMVDRFELQNPDGSFAITEEGKRRKKFSQRRPDPKGQDSWIWSVKNAPIIPYRLPELIEAVANKRTVLIVEGEAKVDLLRTWNIPATCNACGGEQWRAEHSQYLRDADVVILPDNDVTGKNHADVVANALQGIAASVRVLNLPDLPPKGDIIDWARAGGTPERLNDLIAHEAKPWMRENQQESDGNTNQKESESWSANVTDIEWAEPKPLPSGLAPVEAFSSDFLPDALAPWVDDIANRLQCPPDYLGVTSMTALGSVIGRRVGIKPQMKTDWVEIPNLWGMFIGRPGMLKSPAMSEALKPIHHLEAEAVKNNEIAQHAYAVDVDAFKRRQQVKVSLEKEALRKDPRNPPNIDLELGDEPRVPVNVRYRTSDSSYESLGELLISNPTGILVERDELIALLKHLDRDDQVAARGFYLSGWSGMQPYTFDRIGRGHRHIEAVSISVLGNTQPARIAEYVRRANLDGAGGDGLIQRFGLLVWPDASPEWKNVDEYPDSEARENAWKVYKRTTEIDESAALALGASKGQFDKIPTLRFEDAALDDFVGWRNGFESRVRSGEMSPALEGHLAKYRKLVPALALINHIADAGDGPVTRKSLLRALAFANYLETHARRVYGSTSEGELAAAKAILKHIRSGDLRDGFTARDIHQRGWAHLTEREHVRAGLDLLVDLDHLAELTPVIRPQGGRPRVTYAINPRSAR
jgi:hypothetical protein